MIGKQSGRMLVLSGPSGTGKTTIGRHLFDRHGYPNGNLVRAVSVTTRPRRPQEEDGADYLFIPEDRFAALLADGELLEHAELYGYQYGTPREFVADSLKQGLDVLLVLDAHGRQQLADRHDAELISVFLLPPSLDELERRLRGRNEDAEKTVTTRLMAAQHEISRCVEYDYVIRNHDLNLTLALFDTILQHDHRERDLDVAGGISTRGGIRPHSMSA
jgi:guanylate kinase